MTLETPKLETPCSRMAWRLSLIAVGLIGSGLIYFQQSNSRKQAAVEKQQIITQIRNENVGGDNFAFLRAGSADGSSTNLFFMVHNFGETPLRNIKIIASPGESPLLGNNGYASIGGNEIHGLAAKESFPFTPWPGVKLQAQKYHFDISALNGTVFEELEIKIVDGKLSQTIDVRRGRTIILHKTEPVL